MPGQAVYIRYQAVCEFLHNNEDSHSSSDGLCTTFYAICSPSKLRMVVKYVL